MTRRGLFGALLVAAWAAVSAGTVPARAADPVPAPFGLTWGMPVADVKALGAGLNRFGSRRGLETYAAANLPGALTSASTTVLDFHHGRLIKATAVMDGFGPDPGGELIRARFGGLVDILRAKYGTPVVRDETESMCRGGTWRYCLSAGYAKLDAEFQGPGVTVILWAAVPGGGEAALFLSYSNDAMMAAAEKENTAREAGKL